MHNRCIYINHCYNRPPMSDETRIHGCTDAKVRQLMRRLSQHYDAEVSRAGLRNSQYSLLSNTARLGPVKPVELARAMKMTASTLSRNLQPLIEAGWIEVRPSANARSHLVAVTAAGEAKREEAQRYWRLAQRALNTRMGPERVLALHALIDQSLELLGPDSGKADPDA